MITIKHRFTGNIILTIYSDTLSGADLSGANLIYADLSRANLSGADLSRANLIYADLSEANLREANLIYADLSGADLSYANSREANLREANLIYADLRETDLRGADLSGVRCSSCIGNGKEITTLQTPYWPVVFTRTDMAIGCEQHSIEDWRKFKDSRIKLMDEDALEFWKKYKDMIFAFIDEPVNYIDSSTENDTEL